LSSGAFAPLPYADADPVPWPASSPGSASDNINSNPGTAAARIADSVNDSGSIDCQATASPGTPAAPADTFRADLHADTASPRSAPGRTAAQAGTFAASTGPGAGSPDSRVTDPVQALAYLGAALDFLAHTNPAEWAEGHTAPRGCG
jgi:hypothetical protein